MPSHIRALAVSYLVVLAAAPAAPAAAAELRGSPASMERQHAVAQELDYSFLRTPSQVREFVGEGRLVPIEGNADYEVARGVSYPFARPELRTFIERLSGQYREGCGERLVVTSLTRPISSQPVNAHPLSVHPAGMAADFRISQIAACREWLEQTLLALERDELLDVTRERNPPHYHVAVFPAAYMAYVARQEAVQAALDLEAAAPEAVTPEPTEAPATARGWDSDGLARFALVVALSLALVFTLGRPHGGRRIGF